MFQADSQSVTAKISGHEAVGDRENSFVLRSLEFEMMRMFADKAANIPHFRKQLKQARNGHYDFKTALKDLIDNVILKAMHIRIVAKFSDDGKLCATTILDDYVNGFENIDEKGAANPMNWGHTREGQNDDSETSEYGTGMKQAACFIANCMKVITRAVKNGRVSFRNVECNFDEMAARPDELDSYRTDIQELDPIEYASIHPFETGSTIQLSEIRLEEDMQFSNGEECVALIQQSIAEAYSDIMFNRMQHEPFTIEVNGQPVLPENDKFRAVLLDPICQSRLITTTIIFPIAGQTEIIAKCVSANDGEVKYYKLKQSANKKEKVSIRADTRHATKLEFEHLEQTVSTKMTIKSTSTYGSVLEDTHQFKGSLRVKRGGRNYGDIELVNLLGTNSNDGYLNHVFHQLDYTSKELNRFIGICSNKQINSKKENILMMAIRKLIQKLNTALHKKKFSGEHMNDDSDTASVSTMATAVSNLTVSTASSRRRGRPARNVAPVAVRAILPQPEVPPIQREPILPNSFELRSPEFSQSPTALREEIFAVNGIVLQNDYEIPIVEEEVPYVPVAEADTIPAIHAEPIHQDPILDDIAPGGPTIQQTVVQYGRITNQDRTYLTKHDAKTQLDNLSIYANEHPQISIEEDLMEVIAFISRQRGRHLFIIELLQNYMIRPATDDNAHVVGGAKLAEIHAKYIHIDENELQLV
jgi:hypothetical protein